MITQLNAAEAAISSALGTKQFDKPEGGQQEIQFFHGELPDKREEPGQGQDIPFCLLKPGSFRLSKSGTQQAVAATLSLYSSGTRAEGLAMVDDTITRLKSICSRQHTPCKILGTIDGEPGTFDHPYYTFTININFQTI